MKTPQHDGHPSQRVRAWKRHSVDEIRNRNPIGNARVPHTRRETGISRHLHGRVVARRIFGAHDDLQKIWSASHDNPKDKIVTLCNLVDIFELSYSKSLIQ